jgi:hypothetical protein
MKNNFTLTSRFRDQISPFNLSSVLDRFYCKYKIQDGGRRGGAKSLKVAANATVSVLQRKFRGDFYFRLTQVSCVRSHIRATIIERAKILFDGAQLGILNCCCSEENNFV